MLAVQKEVVAARVSDVIVYAVVELDGAHGSRDDDAGVHAHLRACAGGRHEVSEDPVATSREKPTHSRTTRITIIKRTLLHNKG